jgi:hypothetical protein
MQANVEVNLRVAGKRKEINSVKILLTMMAIVLFSSEQV